MHATGIFDDNKYWDVQAEYAKARPDDMLCRLTVTNRSAHDATLHVLPTLWLRNTWSWGCQSEGCTLVNTRMNQSADSEQTVRVALESLGELAFDFDLDVDERSGGSRARLLWTNNETNYEMVYGSPNEATYTKDAFHRFVVNGESGAVSTSRSGSKVAAHHVITLKAGASATIRQRLYRPSDCARTCAAPFADFNKIFRQRQREADEFYAMTQHRVKSAAERLVQRQAYAGMLWSAH